MALSQTQAPDFSSIQVETGPSTHDAMQGLWFLLQNAIIDEARSLDVARNQLEPKVLVVDLTANTNDLPLRGASVVHLTGAASVNLTGFLAPEPGKARVLFVYNTGSGTITLKHEVTSAAANQLTLITAADTTVATRGSAIFIYLSSKWRQLV